MGYFNDLTLSYTAEGARMDRLDGIAVILPHSGLMNPLARVQAAEAERATYTLTPSEIETVNTWLARWAQRDETDDAQLTDDCVFDLDLQAKNNHVYELVLAFLRGK